MAYYILVQVDTNDADYAYSFNQILDEDLAKLEPLFDKIKANKDRHNFPNNYSSRIETTAYDLYVSEETREQDELAIDLFIETYAPVTEIGFHTVESIKIYDATFIQKLL
jgi:hypothetical protein